MCFLRKKELLPLIDHFDSVVVGDRIVAENLGSIVHWAPPHISSGSKKNYWVVKEILRGRTLVLKLKSSSAKICVQRDRLDERSDWYSSPNFSVPNAIHVRFYLERHV